MTSRAPTAVAFTVALGASTKILPKYCFVVLPFLDYAISARRVEERI
jgi:hypothetical protein